MAEKGGEFIPGSLQWVATSVSRLSRVSLRKFTYKLGEPTQLPAVKNQAQLVKSR